MIKKKFMERTNKPCFFKTVDNEYINSLPVKTFTGNIHLIEHARTLETLKHAIQSKPILGFDTETRPSFKKGRYHKVALLQLSTHSDAFLFRLNKMHLPDIVVDILEDKDIIKVGVALKDDLIGLKKIMDLEPDGFVDLQKFVKQYGIEDNGLKKLAANVLGFRISKKSQTSNWEQDELTWEQLVYAATDAWVCQQIYEVLTHSV